MASESTTRLITFRAPRTSLLNVTSGSAPNNKIEFDPTVPRISPTRHASIIAPTTAVVARFDQSSRESSTRASSRNSSPEPHQEGTSHQDDQQIRKRPKRTGCAYLAFTRKYFCCFRDSAGDQASPISATTVPAAAVPDEAKLRLLCSHGGTIDIDQPESASDSQCSSLVYCGGHTQLIFVDRNSSLSELFHRLSTTFLNGRSFTLKYQLPYHHHHQALDPLISVLTDEDLDNMIQEYDLMMIPSSPSLSDPPHLRLFLFPVEPELLTASPINGTN